MKDESYFLGTGGRSPLATPLCRTRSVLRHYPLPEAGGGPRPVRGPALQEQLGKADLTEHEAKAVFEDDVMMWRMMLIYLVAKKAALRKGMPASPERYMPECWSWWRTPQWKAMKEKEGLNEMTFFQSVFGGKTPEESQSSKERRSTRTTRAVADVEGLKELASWAPGLMRSVAKALMEAGGIKTAVRQLSWAEHLANGHTRTSSIDSRSSEGLHPRSGWPLSPANHQRLGSNSTPGPDSALGLLGSRRLVKAPQHLACLLQHLSDPAGSCLLPPPLSCSCHSPGPPPS